MSWATQRDLTSKETIWKEASRSRQTSVELDSKVTRSRSSIITRISLDPNHFRSVTAVKDGGFLLDSSNIKVKIPRENFADLYEDKRLPGYITSIPQLLKLTRDKFQERKFEHVYTINGEKIDSFSYLPDYMTEVIVSSSNSFIGITYGVAYKKCPTFIRKESLKKNLNPREYLKKTNSSTSSVSNLNIKNTNSRQIIHLKSLKKKHENWESIENLRKDYPVDVIVKLLLRDKLSVPDNIESISNLSKKCYTDRIDQFLGLSKEVSTVELDLKTKYRHKYTPSAPPETMKTTPKIITKHGIKKAHSSDEESSSGFETLSDEISEILPRKSESKVEKILSETSSHRKDSFIQRVANSNFIDIRQVANKVPESINISKLNKEFGLSKEHYDKYFVEYTDLAFQSQNAFRHRFSMNEIMQGRLENENKGIRLEYLLAKHPFFMKLPHPLLEHLVSYFSLENVLNSKTWIHITSILIHQTASRRIKIHFVENFLPNRYKQLLALFRSTCKDNSRISSFLKKLISFQCFHKDYTLYKERLGSLLTSSEILVNDILDLLTSFVN